MDLAAKGYYFGEEPRECCRPPVCPYHPRSHDDPGLVISGLPWEQKAVNLAQCRPGLLILCAGEPLSTARLPEHMYLAMLCLAWKVV